MDRSECVAHSVRNMEWFDRNYEALKKDYDNRWIAILDEKVVQADTDLNALLSKIQDHEHKECMVVEFIRAEPIAMFF